VQGTGVTLSIDTRSNSLIFYTSGQRYQTLLPMIRQLDVPPKQILLETMVAEVTLTGEFAYGVEFAFTEGKFSGGTLGNLTLPGGGLSLNYFDSLTNQIRVKLSATNTLVNVLSNPTLVVRDGAEATIMVGNDVPTVGATASDPITSERQITQVLYRQTGLELRILPTINAEGLVVMEIEQRISNTQPGASSVEGAPTFFQRAVSTEVVARSGQSILLAGLVADRQTDNSSRVPFFGDVPGLGWLFRSDSKLNEKTELVVLITPRVIDDPSEWSQIRVGMQTAFTRLQLPESTAAAAVPAAAPSCLDTDRDGACDAVDRCPMTLPTAAVDGVGCEVGEIELPGLTFGIGNAQLTEEDKTLLMGVVVLLQTRSSERADIRGYAYDAPNHESNLRLSQQRADAVRSYLQSKGVSAGRLTSLGLGDAGATDDGSGSDGANRITVEIRSP
jgi:outer membrane protein OmpA-like peptidoglycan-associated protein